MIKIGKELIKYVCRWCGNKFEQMVGTSVPKCNITINKGKKGLASSQVKCPVCTNFIPTY